MKEEATLTLIESMKEAGIDFLASVPSSSFSSVLHAIVHDRHFTHVPVANENDGVGVCAGAWLGGKRPALIAQNSGLLMATYSLLCATYFFGGFPVVLLIEQKGDIYDDSAYWYYGYGHMSPRILEEMQLPYTIVRELSQLKREVASAARAADAYGKATAVLVSGEELLR